MNVYASCFKKKDDEEEEDKKELMMMVMMMISDINGLFHFSCDLVIVFY